ncbi:MAG: hypothetical protein IPK75_17670 [Acidobacteria bacterium]|nr:hypothetical protein [Acidobacteriota bacterium]
MSDIPTPTRRSRSCSGTCFQHTPLGLSVPIAPMAASIDEDLAFDLLHQAVA